MLKNSKGFGILESLISASLLLTVMLVVMRGLNQNKKEMVSLAANSNCESFAASLISNVKAFDNTLKIRNFHPALNTDRVPTASASYPDDYFCRSNNRVPVCDTTPHLQTVGGTLQLGNFQNIRSAATWIGNLYDNALPADQCRRVVFFPTVSTSDRLRFSGILPSSYQLASDQFQGLPADLVSVRMTIDQVARPGAINDCIGNNKVRPNSDLSFNIYFDVEMKMAANADNNPNTRLRTPNKFCRSTANIGYLADRTPAVVTSQPLSYADGTPVTPAPPPNLPNACSTTNNLPSNRNLRLAMSATEPGTQFICKVNSPSPSQWTFCDANVLAFGTPGVSSTTVTPNAAQRPENSPVGIDINWTNLTDGSDYWFQYRAVDTAGNCAQGNPATCTQDVRFRVEPNCGNSFRNNYCINEFPPTGCGGLCPLPGLRPPNCPDTNTYYSCESRCDRNCGSQEFNCGNNYGGLWSARVGTKPFVCPAQGSYCPGVQIRDPCGANGLCPAGTYNGCADEQLCNDDVDICGTPCTGGEGRPDCDPVTGNRLVPGSGPNPGAIPLSRVCLGSTARRPDGSTFTVTSGGLPNTCPPPSTYCSNQVMLDACGQPCAAEGTLVTGCCDRCNSAIQSFESVQECQNAGFTTCTPGVVGSARCVQGS